MGRCINFKSFSSTKYELMIRNSNVNYLFPRKSDGRWWFTALLTCLWKKAKDLRLVRASYLWCYSAKYELVIPGQWLTQSCCSGILPQNCYHLGRVESNCTLRIFYCKSLDAAMDAIHQAKETITSEGIRKVETMNIIHMEVKWLKDQASTLSATCSRWMHRLSSCKVWMLHIVPG